MNFTFKQLASSCLDDKMSTKMARSSGVPDGAARLKTRSAGWNRAGWEQCYILKAMNSTQYPSTI